MRNLSTGLVLVLAGMVGGGCATADGGAEADTSSELTALTVPSYTLNVSADENSIDVFKTDGTFNVCPNPNGCDFPYLGGTQLTLKPFPLIDRVNCVQFRNWVGAVCQGQGSTCVFTINADTSVHAHWIPLKGCSV
jgi:hypothetical protein